MRQISPSDLAIFLCIAKNLNLSRAAVELGLSPSALSHALRGIEERLGLRLFNRTTRSVALTEAGNRLFSRIEPAFRDIDDALEDLNHFRAKPSGTLRINMRTLLDPDGAVADRRALSSGVSGGEGGGRGQ